MSIETVERIIRWVRDVLVIVVCFGAIYLYFQARSAMQNFGDSFGGGTTTEEYVPPADEGLDAEYCADYPDDPMCSPIGEGGAP